MELIEMDKAILKEIDVGETLLRYYNYLKDKGFDNCDERIRPIKSRLKWLKNLYEVKV